MAHFSCRELSEAVGAVERNMLVMLMDFLGESLLFA